jgi:hypothetical protein
MSDKWKEAISNSVIESRKESVSQSVDNLWMFISVAILFYMQGQSFLFFVLLLIGTATKYSLRVWLEKEIQKIEE